MTESTSNHNWTIPEVGGSKDVWGQILNDFFDDELDEEVSLKGPFSDRPSAGSGVAKLYLATDRRIVYYNDGTSWEAVYGLGTEDNPVPDTSHFESIQADSVNTDDIAVADTFDIAHDSDELQSLIDNADRGDTIHLVSEQYQIDEIDQRVKIIGNDPGGTASSAGDVASLEPDNGDVITVSDRALIANCRIDDEIQLDEISTVKACERATITVSADQCAILFCRGANVTFESGTSDGVAIGNRDSSITDNDGSNELVGNT